MTPQRLISFAVLWGLGTEFLPDEVKAKAEAQGTAIESFSWPHPVKINLLGNSDIRIGLGASLLAGANVTRPKRVKCAGEAFVDFLCLCNFGNQQRPSLLQRRPVLSTATATATATATTTKTTTTMVTDRATRSHECLLCGFILRVAVDGVMISSY